MRIWSILLIKSDQKWCIHLIRSLFLYYSSFAKFVFFGPIGNTRWLPWPLIGWDIFDFFSETAKQNSTKLDRKHDLNVLYQVCGFFFRVDQKNKIGWNIFDFFYEIAQWNSTKLDRKKDFILFLLSLFFFGPIGKTRWLFRHLIGWDIFNFFETAEVIKSWQEARSKMSSTKCVFFLPIGKTKWRPQPLIGWEIFDFFTKTAERNSTQLDRKQNLNILYQVCVSGADQKNKMAALASDCLRHFRHFLCYS